MGTIASALAVAGVLVCCGSGGAPHNQLNTCATKNATYLMQLTQKSGNCGPVPDEVVITDAAGIAKIEAPTCVSITQAACKAQATDCASTTKGCTVTQTYSTTFKADGSSATSLVTIRIECTDGSSCMSTYDATITRQKPLPVSAGN